MLGQLRRLAGTSRGPSILLLLPILAAAVVTWVRHQRQVARNALPVVRWEELQQRFRSGSFPETPLRVTGSPQQVWLANVSEGLWTPERLIQLAGGEGSSAGKTVVGLRVKTNATTFTHHYRQEKHGPATTTSPQHMVQYMPLRDALSLIWPSVVDSMPGKAPTGSTAGPYAHSHFYLSMDVTSLDPDMLPYDPDTLLTWIPDGCVVDDTRFTNRPAQLCRGLASNLWIGASGVSATMHYDLQHNIVVQASGTKRWIVFPPERHGMFRLHPRWHGSQRQGQASLREIATAAETAEVHPKIFTLHQGEALYLPPMWFHHVESRSPSVSANFWTHSLYSDTWSLLSNVTDEEGVEVDHPEKDRFRGLFAGHDEALPPVRIYAGHSIAFFQVLQEGESGALFTVTKFAGSKIRKI